MMFLKGNKEALEFLIYPHKKKLNPKTLNQKLNPKNPKLKS